MVDRKEIKWTIYCLLRGGLRQWKREQERHCRPGEQKPLLLLFTAFMGQYHSQQYWPFFFHIFYRLCTFFSLKKWEKKSFCRPEEISRHTRQCLCRHCLTLFFLNAIYNVRDSWECKNAVIYVSTSVTSCALLRFPWGYASISSLLLSHQVLCGIIKCVWCEAVGYRRGVIRCRFGGIGNHSWEWPQMSLCGFDKDRDLCSSTIYWSGPLWRCLLRPAATSVSTSWKEGGYRYAPPPLPHPPLPLCYPHPLA